MEAVEPVPVVEIIGREVLAAGRHLQPVAGVPLEPPHVAGGVLAGQERVLAWSLLPPAPPWVPEYVDVRAPESEPGHSPVVHCSSLV